MSDFILTQLKRLADIFNREQDPEQMLESAVRELRAFFNADRAWILYPCGAGAVACQIRYETAGEEYSEGANKDGCLSLTPGFTELLLDIVASDAPVMHVEGINSKFDLGTMENFNFRSQLAIALRLKNDRPWGLGLHQCSSARRWTETEIDLFQYSAEWLRDAYDAGRLLTTIQKDIAKRQKIDAELMSSEQRFRALFQYSGTSLWLEDFSELKEWFAELRQQGVTSMESYLAERPEFIHKALGMFKVVDVNQATIDLYEADSKQHLLEDISRIFTDGTMETFRAVLLTLFAGNNHFVIEAEYITLKNSIFHTILNIDVLPGIESHMALITVTDISTQKDTEQRLLESRERYRLLMENANDAIFIADAVTGVIMEANKKASDLLGRPINEIVGMHQTELHPPEDREKYRQLFREKTSSTEKIGPHDVFIQRADGKKIPVGISPSVTVINGRTVQQGIFHDISRRLKTEERRRLLAIAVEQAAESVVITNIDGEVEYVNPAFERISGYTFHEVVGKNPRILKRDKTPSYHFQLLWKEVCNGRVWRGRFTNRKKDGTLFEEEATITPVRNGAGQIQYYVAVKRDITRQVLLEKQIKQSQKMQAIGTLAGGIAHDFNNILTAIMGFAEMSCLRSGHDEVLTSNLHEIIHGAERAGKLIDQILTFSRQTEKQ
ncbi:MAG: PAS domain S-box protein, partial [Desulfobulbaceae bacterium]|nr:PAS domain S-box protein [Desulfobulbaceae bacterium]